MAWQLRLNGDSLAWLLEPDAANPTIRFFALRELLDQPADAPAVVAAQAAVMISGPVPAILEVWVDIERKGRPSKWVTLRALRVIKALEGGN